MFENIEKLYKKKSPSNIIKKKTILIYFIGVIFIFIFNLKKCYIMSLITIFLVALKMKKVCEKELDEKLYFKVKKSSGIPLNKIIRNKEIKLFKNYLLENNIYRKELVKIIIEHYRSFNKHDGVQNNLLGIISIVISIGLVFVTKDGFNINAFSNSIPYLVSLVLIVLMIYLPIHKIMDIKK